MRSATPKVQHEILGRSLVGHVLAASADLRPEVLVVVVGHRGDAVAEHVSATHPDAVIAHQDEQLGTGHAVRVALDGLARAGYDVGTGTVVVVNGDTPLLTGDDLQQLLAAQASAGAAAALLTAVLADPHGYGRVLREGGAVTGIVEEADATSAQRALTEVNCGTYAFDGALLRDALGRISSDNAQREEYLTDTIATMVRDGQRVVAVTSADAAVALGVNDQVQLAHARRVMRDRVVRDWLLRGVTVIDPETTWVDVDVTLEPDVVVQPGTQLRGSTSVRKGAQVGPNCVLTDTLVGPGATVTYTVADGAEVGEGAKVGPFTYLRPGTILEAGVKAGAYVEMKNALVHEDAKVPHLSYVGDAEIGEGSNIGAATIFVNYDGEHKHRTTIGSHVRIGSDTMLVAPVAVGDGAYTAAGSVITDDVPPGAMAVARSRQRVIRDWVLRRRAGSASAAAAQAAGDSVPAAQPPDSDQHGDPVTSEEIE